MSNKNEVFEYLIDQLRQQVNNNQCEDLAHEVQSLQNQLRDMSELVDELLGTITIMNGKSSCRKEEARGCAHNWIIAPGLFIAEGHKDNVPGSRFCCECGAREWDVQK